MSGLSEVRVLYMQVKKKYFRLILRGEKTTEYREIKPYWTKKLARSYDVIVFQVGYHATAPRLTVEYKGYGVENIFYAITNEQKDCYALRLGEILVYQHCEELLKSDEQQGLFPCHKLTNGKS
jgi:hypothetical protein